MWVDIRQVEGHCPLVCDTLFSATSLPRFGGSCCPHLEEWEHFCLGDKSSSGLLNVNFHCVESHQRDNNYFSNPSKNLRSHMVYMFIAGIN